MTITPEQRLENVKAALRDLEQSKRHRGRINAIRSTRAQLAEMWVKYRRGELTPVTDDLPF